MPQQDNLYYLIRNDWYGFPCVGCGEEVQMPDVWVQYLARNDHSFICGCGYEMSLPAACVDEITG